MNAFGEFVQQYGATIIYTIVTAILGYLGIVIKNLIAKYLDDKTKRDIVKSCVRAVEQIYKDENIHGQEKVDKVIEYATEILASKGIEISASEIKILIEQFVIEMNNELNKDVETIEEPVAKKVLKG